MSLKNEIRLIEDELNDLLTKLAEVRLRVESIETQNAKLLDRVSEKDLHNEGDEALMKLYNEGYHICPTHFAKSREGEECLLCMAFMQAQKDGEA
ncbi:MAG: initiation control protein YabA [Bacillota bacterium]|jgi:regulator of replication initiation timing